MPAAIASSRALTVAHATATSISIASRSRSRTNEPRGRDGGRSRATVVSNVADGLREEPWRSEALAREYPGRERPAVVMTSSRTAS